MIQPRSKLLVSLLLVLAATSLVTASSGREVRGLLRPSPFRNQRQQDVKPSSSSSPLETRGGSGRPDPPTRRASLVVCSPPSRRALLFIGCLLAANSGFLNGLALSGALIKGQNQAVAAVTGAYTTSALAAQRWRPDDQIMKTQFSVIASYLGGSCINGLLNPLGINWEAPQTSMLVAAGLMLGSFALIPKALEGTLVSKLQVWCCWALAIGVQNSWTSMLLAGNVLRTAHFSGITSDMGTILGQLLRGGQQNAWKLPIFAVLAASFWVGGLWSVPAAREFDRNCLLVSVVIYLALPSYLYFFTSSPPSKTK
jgi:uncharacterized membrane protein YoaK (UPF0700 family)